MRDNLIKQPKPQIYGLKAFFIFSIITIGWSLFRLSAYYEQERSFDRADAISAANLQTGTRWFEDIKSGCTTAQVDKTIDSTTYSYHDSVEGQAYAAACYALGGKIEKASDILAPLQFDDRNKAARILGEIGRIAANREDYRSAGSVMALVLKYYPQNAAAMYQVGISAYAVGDLPLAKLRLTKFLQIYPTQDAWTKEARIVLKKIELNIGKDTKS